MVVVVLGYNDHRWSPFQTVRYIRYGAIIPSILELLGVIIYVFDILDRNRVSVGLILHISMEQIEIY